MAIGLTGDVLSIVEAHPQFIALGVFMPFNQGYKNIWRVLQSIPLGGGIELYLL
jgi:hypothetical protein